MCGILGVYNINNENQIYQEKFRDSLLHMYHRGPDAHDIKQFASKAILGHLRLSIIDLDPKSNQPFQVDNRFWITYNGEIYNYIELRDELISHGYNFRTQSDTEVLINSYLHWGEDCVNRFNGMWAFVIYDSLKNTLFCSRDRFGIKPFNYAIVNNQFIFSSEIKAILKYYPELKRPNYNVIANYCRTSVGAQIRETWFEDIYRLEPAHNMVVDQEGCRLYRYWDYPRKVNKEISFDEAVKKYRELFLETVTLRLRSDVPVGFTLSSGLDSSSIVSVLKNGNLKDKNTYTAVFEKVNAVASEKSNFKHEIKINEQDIVRKLTDELKLKPTIVEIDFLNYTTKLSKIIGFLESGHSSPAILPLFQVMEEAKKDVTVVLEGQGADELLAGYISNVYPVFLIQLLKKFKLNKFYFELRKYLKVYSIKSTIFLFIRLSEYNYLKRFYFWFSGMEKVLTGKIKKYKTISDFPIEPKGFDDELNIHLYKAHTGGLVNLLHYGDAISMAHSLESRLPFLDYRLVEFVYSLPSDFKIKNGLGKYIHRVAMKGIVPDYILESPYKFGFETPIHHVLKEGDQYSPKNILLSEICIERGLFSKDGIIEAFELFEKGKIDNSRFLYRLLSVELWFREFID